ncbi:hypothetical protein [Desulfosporosinus sp. OT]|uniref:hypothetical protein n=1 Tax=Desulfosporosinus sp. OT TaxID=913865 RepID=UPI000314B599|nr:hypothetical protein [Desulfosporosinus sp. OT]
MRSIISRVRVKWSLLIMLICLVVGTVYSLSPLPNRDAISLAVQKNFEVPINTGFELQGKNQCAAYSTAFVLRNSGKQAKGIEVYAEIPFKIPISGYVLPKGVLSYLQSQGLKPMMYKGDLSSLKARLVEGQAPVIVLVGNKFFWQHYMTLVGFDEDKNELYFFDSDKVDDENAELPGNRTMTNDYFLKWWSNGLPVFNHVYITVAK